MFPLWFIGSTGWPPIDHPPGLRRSRKDLLISLNDCIAPKGLRHNGDMRLNTERSFL
ncbi:unnamed protein product [Musa acuminata subsp. malaccensis]|uniref:(wild Malaysian banana) hypothetical protein n=1 Tax=Musa acuminata subsp. malaccensis TaxID=214687 RepID=A0A804KAN2_MUSAM|nr:unnamed protein product [Musa acuminata subsp. malaccensis]